MSEERIGAEELRTVLEAVERGDVTIEPVGDTADEVYAGDVIYKASNGWTIRATCAVAVIRDGRHVACGLDCERVHGGFAEDGEGGPGVGWECPVHGCVGAQLRESQTIEGEQR